MNQAMLIRAVYWWDSFDLNLLEKILEAKNKTTT